MQNLMENITKHLSTTLMIMLVVIPIWTFTSCVSTFNNPMGDREEEIRQINRSVQSQQWICDTIEEPVYYRGRKIYNGCHTRYHRYQSTTTGKMYRPKKKLLCQELGERPFTEENLDRIATLRKEIAQIKDDLNYRMLRNIGIWIFLFLILVYISRDEIEDMRN